MDAFSTAHGDLETKVEEEFANGFSKGYANLCGHILENHLELDLKGYSYKTLVGASRKSLMESHILSP